MPIKLLAAKRIKKKDVNAKLTTNFFKNILKYETDQLKPKSTAFLQNQQTLMQSKRSPMQN